MTSSVTLSLQPSLTSCFARLFNSADHVSPLPSSVDQGGAADMGGAFLVTAGGSIFFWETFPDHNTSCSFTLYLLFFTLSCSSFVLPKKCLSTLELHFAVSILAEVMFGCKISFRWFLSSFAFPKHLSMSSCCVPLFLAAP